MNVIQVHDALHRLGIGEEKIDEIFEAAGSTPPNHSSVHLTRSFSVFPYAHESLIERDSGGEASDRFFGSKDSQTFYTDEDHNDEIDIKEFSHLVDDLQLVFPPPHPTLLFSLQLFAHQSVEGT